MTQSAYSLEQVHSVRHLVNAQLLEKATDAPLAPMSLEGAAQVASKRRWESRAAESQTIFGESGKVVQ